MLETVLAETEPFLSQQTFSAPVHREQMALNEFRRSVIRCSDAEGDFLSFRFTIASASRRNAVSSTCSSQGSLFTCPAWSIFCTALSSHRRPSDERVHGSTKESGAWSQAPRP